MCGIALYYHLNKSETNETYTVLSATVKDTEYWESCILVIGDYEFVVPEGIYSKTHIGDTTTLKYFYDNGRLLRVQFGDMVISKYITMRDYNRTLWFLLIAIMFLSVVGDYPCQALGIWAMLFAGYGIGIPSIDKRYVIMSTVCYVVATILFMAGDGRFISKVLMTEISYYYTSNWNDWVSSDLFSYCSIAIVLACIWLV